MHAYYFCDSWLYLRNKKTLAMEKHARVLGGAEWIRTTDSRIFSPMLYQLSYSTLKKWMQN